MPPIPTLPPTERLLWDGAPDWRSLARTLFHVRLVAAYFVGLTLLNMGIEYRHAGGVRPGLQAALETAVPSLLAGTAAVLILLALALATSRTTRYTLTERRLILQFGVALPATLMVPWHQVTGSAVRIRGDHTGDISLTMRPGSGLTLVKLWPLTRSWRLRDPMLLLRDIPRVATVAPLLARALAASAADPDRRAPASSPSATAATLAPRLKQAM